MRTKCARGDIERRCREVGVTFQAMIFESTGGVTVEAERVMKCLNKAVAANSDSSEEIVATRFWQRIGIDLPRGSCRAFIAVLSTRVLAKVLRVIPLEVCWGLALRGACSPSSPLLVF